MSAGGENRPAGFDAEAARAETERLDRRRGHKFVTAEMRRRTPDLYATEDVGLPDKVVTAKFFHPYGHGTWLVIEFDEDTGTAFGWAELQPGCGEFGLCNLYELGSVARRVGGTEVPAIERDVYFRPQPLRELTDEHDLRLPEPIAEMEPTEAEVAQLWAVFDGHHEDGEQLLTSPATREEAIAAREALVEADPEGDHAWTFVGTVEDFHVLLEPTPVPEVDDEAFDRFSAQATGAYAAMAALEVRRTADALDALRADGVAVSADDLERIEAAVTALNEQVRQVRREAALTASRDADVDAAVRDRGFDL